LYECSDSETNAIIKQIVNKYQNSWNQTRLIATSFSGVEIPFEWDNVESENNSDGTPYTPDDMQKAFSKFQETINQ
jgi:hypothetical protein